LNTPGQMKHLKETTTQIRTTVVDWVFYKGFELFVSIYGR